MQTGIGEEKTSYKKEAIVIIPARGGSKRVPRKNIKPFMEKPVIAYSIEAALQSGLFSKVMVSTDDEEIAQIARQYGAEVPFYRSSETSNDFATTADVIIEVLNRYEQMGFRFGVVCCLYSTAPFVTPNRLVEAYNMLDGDIDSVFTAVAFSYPVQRGLRIVKGRISMVHPEYLTARSQDLEPVYHDAGQFYFSTNESFVANKSFWGKNTAGLILSELEVQDLDTLVDWQLAEMKFKLLKAER